MCQYLFVIYPFIILGCIFLCFELIPGEKSPNKIDKSCKLYFNNYCLFKKIKTGVNF